MAQLKSTNITGNLSVTGNVLASKIIKFGGTSDDILMGDGSTTSKQGLIDSLEASMEDNSWRPVKYGSTTISDTSTTLEFAAGSNIGLTFTGGKLTIANNYSYSLPLAANGTRGGIQIGYTASGANLPVQLSSEKAYVALTKTAVESVVTIPTVYDGTLTLKASDGATATEKTFTANDADNVTFEVKHAVPTGASATSYGPSDGGEQTAKGTLDIVVPQITTDKFGHVTSVSNKTFKVTDTNTDTQVTQTVTTSSDTSKRPLLLGYSYSDANPVSFSTVTNTAYASHNIYVSPKEGYLHAKKFTGASTSVFWYQGRDSAVFRDTGSIGYHAALSLKTTNGSWEFGNYNASGYHDIPLLTYITDADYNSKNNSTTYQIKFPLKSGTIALTSDLSSFITSVPGITITDDDTEAATKKIVSGITASEHTITINRIGLSDLGLASAYKFKGSKDKYENLPISNNVEGDVWNVTDTGMNYAWTGSEWDALGSTVDVSGFVQKPSSSTTLGLAYFTDTTGKTLGSSKTTISAAGLITVPVKTGIAMSYTSGGDDVWLYPKDADTYGIRYFEGTPDAMAFSATANNSTKAGADLCINGNGDGTVTMRGKNIATQDWVTAQLGSGGDYNLSNYVTKSTEQTISGVKIFTAQPVISTANGLQFNNGNCKLRIYNTSASPTDYAAIEVRSNSTSTNRNLFIDLANNSLVVGAASGTPDTTYKVNVKDTFNATTIYENGKSIATQDWVTEQIGSGGSGSNSEWAQFLKPQDSATSDGASIRTGSAVTASTWKRGWSQCFKHTGISSDTGDINFWLRPSTYASNGTELCVVIDGDFYGHTGSKRVAYKDELPTVNNGTLTLQTSGQGISGDTTTFTANQSSNAAFTITLNSSSEGNRKANQVVIAKADGTINSAKYTITKTDGTTKASWQYNDSTDCVELVW